MSEQDFKHKNIEEWTESSQLLDSLKKGTLPEDEVNQTPQLFRKISGDLMLARQRMYSEKLCNYLNNQVVSWYALMHQRSGGFLEKCSAFFRNDFPVIFRKEWRLFVISLLVFIIPFIGMCLSYESNPEWVYSVLGEEEIESVEQMYGKDAAELSEVRDQLGSNFMMFGFYINNNIGIDLLAFASGIIFCIGSCFILFSNGLSIGSVFSYVLHEGSPEKLLSFVSGHAPYEIVGMLISAAAGLKLGLAIIKPGKFTRRKALLENMKVAMPLLLGACALTFIAAIIEGFWSASSFASNEVKYIIGYIGWALLFIYFGFVGKAPNEA